ncbi:MAG: hypothetical protein FWC40_10295 [Proteobacteria bacterium]|nr:hypothetical protein [Pseudomonadota bacterium]
MSLKHLMLSGLIVMAVNVSCSSVSSQRPPQEAIQPSPLAYESAVAIEASEATWGNDMIYGSLFKGDADTEAVLAVVEVYFDAKQKAYEREWQEFVSRIPEAADETPATVVRRAYARYSIGNLAFVEISTVVLELTHSDGRNRYVGVILGDNSRLVDLPDKVLFVHFAKNIRPNPEKLEVDERIRTALLLAIGLDGYERDPAPTWTDEDGALVIRYKTHYPNASMRWDNDLYECILTVDADQAFTHACPSSKAQIARAFSNIRNFPDTPELREHGTKLALKYATGSESYEPEPAPTWTDEGGTPCP